MLFHPWVLAESQVASMKYSPDLYFDLTEQRKVSEFYPVDHNPPRCKHWAESKLEMSSPWTTRATSQAHACAALRPADQNFRWSAGREAAFTRSLGSFSGPKRCRCGVARASGATHTRASSSMANGWVRAVHVAWQRPACSSGSFFVKARFFCSKIISMILIHNLWGKC